jgi:hypothetical protein
MFIVTKARLRAAARRSASQNLVEGAMIGLGAWAIPARPALMLI